MKRRVQLKYVLSSFPLSSLNNGIHRSQRRTRGKRLSEQVRRGRTRREEMQMMDSGRRTGKKELGIQMSLTTNEAYKHA